MATIELNRRRVLSAILIIGLAAAGAGAGTIAFFSDTESSTNNVIQAGTLNIGDPADEQINVTDTVPDTWHNFSVSAQYSGSVDAEIDMNVTLSESAEPPEPSVTNGRDLSATEFAENLTVATANATIGTTTENLLDRASIDDGNNNGRVDLADLRDAGLIDNVTSVSASDTENVELELDLYFVSSAGNEAQADGVNVTVYITAEQREADA